MTKSICIAQIEVVTGDIKNNTRKIIKCIEESTSDYIIFPETATSGYQCGNLFLNDQFVQECEDSIDTIAKTTLGNNKTVIVGSVRKVDKLYNSAFVLRAGKIFGVTDKQFNANEFQHDDNHYWGTGNKTGIYDIDNFKFSVIICQDIWEQENDLYVEMKKENVDLVFCINASYNTFTKRKMRCELFDSKEHMIDTAYINSVGIGDISKNFVNYSGESMIATKDREYFFMDAYKEQIKEIKFNPVTKEFLHSGLDTNRDVNKYDMIIDTASYSIRKSLEYAGIKRLSVLVSGGIDSAVVAYLGKKAMGSDKCTFISMPSKNNGLVTRGFAQDISDKLGVELLWTPIQDYVDIFKSTNQNASPLEIATFESTVRSSLALAHANKDKSAFISGSNGTEKCLGFENYLDCSYVAIIAPISDLTKTEIFELAEYINKREGEIIINEELYNGECKPMAELEDQVDENGIVGQGSDPYDYRILSEVCACVVRENQSNNEYISKYVTDRIGHVDEKELNDYINMAKKLFRRTAFKRSQGANTLILNDGFSYGFSIRDTLINKWEG